MSNPSKESTKKYSNFIELAPQDLPDGGKCGVYTLTDEGVWEPGDGFDGNIESNQRPEIPKSQLEKLKESVVNFEIVLNVEKLIRYIDYKLWVFLQNEYCTDSPVQIINKCESPADFKIYLANTLNEICLLVTNDLVTLKTKYEKLSYLKNELQWAKKALVGFDYPISLDFFNNYQMVKPEKVPEKYKMTWCKGELYDNEAIENLEQLYIPKVVEYRFNTIADYIVFLNNQIDIIQALNIPSIPEGNQPANDKEKDFEIHIDTKPIIKLPEFFTLPNKQKPIRRLDIRQTALLFELMKDKDVVLNYDYDDLAKIVSALTGHSEQNLRTTDGFGVKSLIFSDKEKTKTKNFKKIQNHNLIVVKGVLEEIVGILDKQMESNLLKSKG